MNATKTPYYIISDALCRAEIIAGATQLIGQIAVPLANARAALAELERAAAEPVAWCNPSEFASFVGKPRTGAQTHALDVFSQRGGRDTMPLYAAPPAPVAEIRDVVVTDEMCDRAYIGKWRGVPELIGHEPDDEDRQWAREWLEAWRAELGPALGMVELKDPTPEECEEIERLWSRTLDSVSETQEVRPETCGRAMFDACRAVLWPKEGL